jgi:hypothetical protein
MKSLLDRLKYTVGYWRGVPMYAVSLSDAETFSREYAAQVNQLVADELLRDGTITAAQHGAFVGRLRPEPTAATMDRHMMFARVQRELDRAYAKHGREQWSRHEFFGILEEEFDEMWDEIKADAPQENVLQEMMELVGVCFRYFETKDRIREPATARAA